MTIVVEDGTGLSTANSYVSGDYLVTYAEDRAITLASSDDDAIEAALVRATVAIDGSYRLSFPGYRAQGRAQGLEWPRFSAYDYEGLLIDGESVPDEVARAVCEAAIRELESPGSMTPDLERGGFVRRMKAGSVEIEYGGSSNQTTYTIIDGILAKIISGGVTTSSMFGATVRS